MSDPLDALRDVIRAVVREELEKLQPATPYLTTAQAARLASLTQDTIRAWIASGKLRAVRAGHVHRIQRADLETALRSPRRVVEAAAPESAARRKFG